MCYVCHAGRGFSAVAGNLRWLPAIGQFAVKGTLSMCAANIFQQGTAPGNRRSKETETFRSRRERNMIFQSCLADKSILNLETPSEHSSDILRCG